MQTLYSALMALARSAEDAANGGWLCHYVGSISGPKCANGLVTWHLGAYQPAYLSSGANYGFDSEPALLAGRALLQVADPEAVRLAKEEAPVSRLIKALDNPYEANPNAVEDAVALLNDISDGSEDEVPYLNSVKATEWFWRAFDLLAKELPEPIPANPLTVDAILATEGAREPVLTS